MSLPVLAAAAVPVVVQGGKMLAESAQVVGAAAQSLKHPVTAVVAVAAIIGVTAIALKKKRISFKVGNAIHLEASD
jgi:hypothetical protein